MFSLTERSRKLARQFKENLEGKQILDPNDSVNLNLVKLSNEIVILKERVLELEKKLSNK